MALTYSTTIRTKTGRVLAGSVRIAHDNKIYVYTPHSELIWCFTPDLMPLFAKNDRNETQFRFHEGKIFADRVSPTQMKTTSEITLADEDLQSCKIALEAMEAVSGVKPLPDAVKSKIQDAYKLLGIDTQKGIS